MGKRQCIQGAPVGREGNCMVYLYYHAASRFEMYYNSDSISNSVESTINRLMNENSCENTESEKKSFPPTNYSSTRLVSHYKDKNIFLCFFSLTMEWQWLRLHSLIIPAWIMHYSECKTQLDARCICYQREDEEKEISLILAIQFSNPFSSRWPGSLRLFRFVNM